MSVESYIRALPKVDLSIQLEGALQRETLMLIAEQNDVASSMKNQKEFNAWVELFDAPDYERVDQIARLTASWLRHPEDLARAVYDLGVSLSKQNVRYAEVSVIPAIYTDMGMSFETFLDAINDGRDRAERGWKVRMAWVVSIPRNRPRKGDDISRWATGTAARKGNVAALGLIGGEDEQPLGQFMKAFATAEKKELPRVSQAHGQLDLETLEEMIDTLHPNRLLDAWGIADNPDAITLLLENELPLVVTPTREVRLGRIQSAAEYPLRQLYDAGITVSVSTGMPGLYKTSIVEELVSLYEMGMTLDEIEAILLNGIRVSFLPDDEKQAMLSEFTDQITALRDEHLTETDIP